MNSPRGSLWHRWDLHFHTPSSFDYGDKSVTNAQIVDRLVHEGVRVVAVTDHHTIDVDRLRELQALGEGQLTVLPGIELRSEHGAKPINYICIFPEDCRLEDVWARMQGALKLTPSDLERIGGNDRIYVPLKEAAELTHQLGGIVTIHAGAKSNSIEEIRNENLFQQRIKYDITKNWVDILEIGQLRDIERYISTVFPTIGLEKPLVLCSDNHDISSYANRGPTWLRADPTFRGLQMVLREPRDRVFIGTTPPETERVRKNPTKYIRSVDYARRPGAPDSQKWFTTSVEFSSGLVAIVGNKGSGKSALADTIGLLGGTKNSTAFSFLNRERFRHPGSGLASAFEATLTWESGESITRGLSENPDPEEVERVKYLPQDHLERVCNELAASGPTGFEQELKSVIFSHVPDEKRLGQVNPELLT